MGKRLPNTGSSGQRLCRSESGAFFKKGAIIKVKKIVVLIACVILILAAITMAILATSYHRVVVVEGISGTPISGAYISIQRFSGSPEEVGRTDVNGKLTFWTSPLPFPKTICAQSTFYPMGCVSAISLTRQIIELAVPASTP
jgi:hypothetical protein